MSTHLSHPQPIAYSLTMHRRRALACLLAPALATVVSGCATSATVSAPGDDRAVLLERARAYWAAMHANDLVTAWQYEAISRDPNWTLQNYLKRVGGIHYREVRVLEIQALDGDRATVAVFQKFDVPLARLRDQQATILDHWVRMDGRWFHDRRYAGPASQS